MLVSLEDDLTRLACGAAGLVMTTLEKDRLQLARDIASDSRLPAVMRRIADGKALGERAKQEAASALASVLLDVHGRGPAISLIVDGEGNELARAPAGATIEAPLLSSEAARSAIRGTASARLHVVNGHVYSATAAPIPAILRGGLYGAVVNIYLVDDNLTRQLSSRVRSLPIGFYGSGQVFASSGSEPVHGAIASLSPSESELDCQPIEVRAAGKIYVVASQLVTQDPPLRLGVSLLRHSGG
jgi:hypothetical protein